MSLRVTKPIVDVAQKLAELDRPVGNHGSQLMKSASGAESFSLVGAGRKNMIINGQMWINQRNQSSSIEIPNATGGTYQLDRWAVNEATGGTVSVNMDGDPRNYTVVSEFQKAMQFACTGTDTSMGSTENLHFFQNIEGQNCSHLAWGTSTAKDVTLSFWVKTNKAGTYCVGLENNATNRCCIREFTHDGSHTWQKFVLTYPGCPDGTWEVGASIGIRVRFCLASGTNYDDGADGHWVGTDELTTGNQVNFMDSTNNRFFITGVQLEEGSVATPFEHRSYGEEFALCERYYQILMKEGGGYARTGGLGGTTYSNGQAVYCPCMFPTEMRAKPTIISSGTDTFRGRLGNNNNFDGFSGTNDHNRKSATFLTTGLSSGNVGQYHWLETNSGALLALSAEL